VNKLLSRLAEVLVSEAMFAIAVFESDGESVYLNKMAEQLLEAKELKLHQLTPHAGDMRSQILAFSPEFLRHDGLYQDILLRRPDGQTFIANVGIRSVTVDQHFLSILMFQDVTLQKKLQRDITAKQMEIKAAHEELLKQNHQLKELDLAKNKFIAVTTHELKTPLSAMVASAEILKLGLYDTPEQLKEFVDIIHDQGKQLTDLVNDILDFAKIQAGKMDFYIEYQDLLPHLQNVLRNFGDMAQAAQITIETGDLGVDAVCYFDEVRMRQVMANIINNAIKYNRNGGTLSVKIEESKDKVKVLFSDSGKGIPADQFDKVFNEFETIGHLSAHHKGTGLGMPISKKLIEGMGGTIAFSSTVNVGTTFWIEIPKEKVLSNENLYRPRPEKTDDLAA
jgi:signal transduction histidine kinase